MLTVRHKTDGKPAIVFNGKAVATTLLGIFGAVVLGVGMCMTMIWDMMAAGVIVGIIRKRNARQQTPPGDTRSNFQFCNLGKH